MAVEGQESRGWAPGFTKPPMTKVLSSSGREDLTKKYSIAPCASKWPGSRLQGRTLSHTHSAQNYIRKTFNFPRCTKEQFCPFVVPPHSPQKSNGSTNLRNCIFSIKCVNGQPQALFVVISVGWPGPVLIIGGAGLQWRLGGLGEGLSFASGGACGGMAKVSGRSATPCTWPTRAHLTAFALVLRAHRGIADTPASLPLATDAETPDIVE